MGRRRTRDDGRAAGGGPGTVDPAPQADAAASGAAEGGLDPTAVRRFLAGDPAFLAAFILDHPHLWSQLPGMAVQRPDGAVDLSNYLVGRLRGEIDQLKSQQREIIDTTRANAAIQGRVHRAVLTLLEAGTLERMVHAVSCDLTMLLDIDVAQVVVEIDDRAAVPRCPNGVRLVPSGSVARLLEGHAIRLRVVGEGDERVYGPGFGLVGSEALVRLDIGSPAPPALLALGSRRADMFEPGMRTDMLAFLGRVVEHCLRQALTRGY